MDYTFILLIISFSLCVSLFFSESSRDEKLPIFEIFTCVLSFFFFSIFLWFGFEVRLFGAKGLTIISFIGLLMLSVYYFVVRFTQKKKFIKAIAMLLTGSFYSMFFIALVPYLGYLVVFHPLNSLVGFERKVIFETESHIFEKSNSVPMSGGNYDYSIFEKHFLYDKKIKKYYGSPAKFDEMKSMDDFESRKRN